jgi:hypothetical protein
MQFRHPIQQVTNLSTFQIKKKQRENRDFNKEIFYTTKLQYVYM